MELHSHVWIIDLTKYVLRERKKKAREACYRSRVQVRDVSARGARIRFIEAGQPGEREPLILVHDALASKETFLGAIERLARSFHVVAPDLPGFGASEKPDPMRYAYGYDAFAEALFDLVAGLGLGRVHVCGHAMGGGVALTLAAKHPALVHKLVLVDALVFAPEPRREPALERMGRVPLAGGILWKQIVGRPLFRAYLEASVYAGAQEIPDGRVDALYDAFDEPAARLAAHATILAKSDTRPLVARLPRVSADTFVIWGRDDCVAPIDDGRRVARELRGRFEVLECGRCPPDEMPDAFADAVTSFLRAGETPPKKKPPASHRSA